MSMPDDLHARLVAALQTRLEVARAVAWPDPESWSAEGHLVWAADRNLAAKCRGPEHGAFIAANDPATEIRQVEALLRVVERHANPHGCVGPDGTDWVFRRAAACPTLIDLAAGEGIEVGE